MKPNAKIRNANTGEAFSDVRYAASSVALSERGERPEKYNLVDLRAEIQPGRDAVDRADRHPEHHGQQEQPLEEAPVRVQLPHAEGRHHEQERGGAREDARELDDRRARLGILHGQAHRGVEHHAAPIRSSSANTVNVAGRVKRSGPGPPPRRPWPRSAAFFAFSGRIEAMRRVRVLRASDALVTLLLPLLLLIPLLRTQDRLARHLGRRRRQPWRLRGMRRVFVGWRRRRIVGRRDLDVILRPWRRCVGGGAVVARSGRPRRIQIAADFLARRVDLLLDLQQRRIHQPGALGAKLSARRTHRRRSGDRSLSACGFAAADQEPLRSSRTAGSVITACPARQQMAGIMAWRRVRPIQPSSRSSRTIFSSRNACPDRKPLVLGKTTQNQQPAWYGMTHHAFREPHQQRAGQVGEHDVGGLGLGGLDVGALDARGGRGRRAHVRVRAHSG